MIPVTVFYLLSFVTATVCNCDQADLKLDLTQGGDIIHSMVIQGVYGKNSMFTNTNGQPQLPRTDPYGCRNDSYGHLSSYNISWVAIVKRGLCKIEQKIYNSVHLRNAAAVIVYNNAPEKLLPSLTYEGYPAVFVLVSVEDGWRILEFLNTSLKESAIFSITKAAPKSSRYDLITVIVAAIITSTAVAANAGVIFAISSKKAKCKPYVLFVLNILATDIFIGLLSAVQVALLYDSHRKCKQQGKVEETKHCVVAFLARVWDVLLYSNLLSILLLTGEQFLAFRWPLSHRRFVTKGRARLAVISSWLIALLPDGCTAAHALLSFEEPMSEFCRHLAEDKLQPHQYWGLAACVVATTTVALVAVVCVHGYIVYFINKLSIGKLERGQKRKAFVTSALLVVSFVASYGLLFAININIATEGTAATLLLERLRQSLTEVLPTSPLIFDFLVNGMLGALLNPIIYLARDSSAQIILFGQFRGVVRKKLPRFPSARVPARPANGSAESTFYIAAARSWP